MDNSKDEKNKKEEKKSSKEKKEPRKAKEPEIIEIETKKAAYLKKLEKSGKFVKEEKDDDRRK